MVLVCTQGATVKVMVNFFRIKLDKVEEKTLAEEIVGSSFDHIAEGVGEIVGFGGLSRVKVSICLDTLASSCSESYLQRDLKA